VVRLSGARLWERLAGVVSSDHLWNACLLCLGGASISCLPAESKATAGSRHLGLGPETAYLMCRPVPSSSSSICVGCELDRAHHLEAPIPSALKGHQVDLRRPQPKLYWNVPQVGTQQCSQIPMFIDLTSPARTPGLYALRQSIPSKASPNWPRSPHLVVPRAAAQTNPAPLKRFIKQASLRTSHLNLNPSADHQTTLPRKNKQIAPNTDPRQHPLVIAAPAC